MMFLSRRVASRRRFFVSLVLTLLIFKTALFILRAYQEYSGYGHESLVQTFTRVPARKVRRESLNNSVLQPWDTWDWKDFPQPQVKKVIIYWSGVRGHKVPVQKSATNHTHHWPFFYAGKAGECPVPCELSNDKKRASEASAFVVHAREPDIWTLPSFEFLAPWILQTNENSVYTPSLTDPSLMSKFNLLISYRLDSDFTAPIYPEPGLDQPVPFKDRLGDVLAIFSKCEPVRTEYMGQLMKHIEVHSYGKCLKNRDGLIGLYGMINNKYVFKQHKLVLSQYYKFSLVFMNQDCDYFVDDRLYHALTAGSVPVYMGTDKIDDFLPGNLKNSIIKVSDFRSPRELAEYLKFLSNNETEYNKYLEWKWKGLGDINNTKIGQWWRPRFPLFCKVCMALAKGKLHKGLKPDICQPRLYEDWGLVDPKLPSYDYYTVGVYGFFAVVILMIFVA